jgi:catechol 2,3-dioxygenase-like lactoylglutathione lyase family enzyme
MSTNPIFNFKGLDHLALTVSDMKRSVDFYHGTLGMPVLHTLEYANEAGEIIGQHWFLGVGDPGNPHAHLALFWWRDGYQTLSSEDIQEGKKPAFKLAKPIGALIHWNLRVDPENMRPYAQKLTDMGIPFRHVSRYAADTSQMQASGLVNIGMRGISSRNEYHDPEEGWLMNSIYVFDPDGVEVEFNAWAPAWRDWPANAIPRSNKLEPA